MPVSLYGPIVTEADLRDGFKAGLKLWLPHYLAEVGFQHGRDRDALPKVRSFHSAPDFDKWPEDQLPAVVVIAPGLVDLPSKGGDGEVTSRWGVSVGVVVKGRTREETMTLAGLYAAAIRTAVLQQPSAMGTDGVAWMDEAYTEVDSEASRTLAAGMVQFAVDIDGTVDVFAGPADPPPDPYADPGDSPSVSSVTVDTEMT